MEPSHDGLDPELARELGQRRAVLLAPSTPEEREMTFSEPISARSAMSPSVIPSPR